MSIPNEGRENERPRAVGEINFVMVHKECNSAAKVQWTALDGVDMISIPLDGDVLLGGVNGAPVFLGGKLLGITKQARGACS